MIQEKQEPVSFCLPDGHLDPVPGTTVQAAVKRRYARFCTELFHQRVIEIIIRGSGCIPRASLSETVPCDCRHSRIKVALIAADCLGTFRVEQIADKLCRIPFSLKDKAVLSILRQRVRLLDPDPEDVTERTGVASEMNEVVIIDDPAEKGGDKRPAVFHEAADLLIVTAAV